MTELKNCICFRDYLLYLHSSETKLKKKNEKKLDSLGTKLMVYFRFKTHYHNCMK